MNIKSALIAGVVGGVLVFSMITTPLFAANNNFFDFGENGWGEFFDSLFKRKLTAVLAGQEEVPGPGDPDGRGGSILKIELNKSELCVEAEVKNIDQATAAHIHHAPRGATGAVVVALPIPNDHGLSTGCLSVHNTLLEAIKENPEDYYINVYNNPYPNGAIRGQLSR